MCKLTIVLSFLGVIGASVGQILQNGQCDTNINLFQNFDVEQFLGTWHELARADTDIGGDCSTIEFTRAGDSVAVSHKTVRQNFFQEYVGTASVEEGTARLTLSLPQASSNPIDFWVINTDYNVFALTYGCENVGTTQRRVYLWQLGRENSFPNQMVQAALNTAMLNLFGITPEELYNISYEEDACFVLPILEPGTPVIFEGQCDQNISGIANFDVSRFLGVWHEVSSYHSENALGTCSRAQYTDGGDRVNVVNSQVINQRLLTVGGYATVISNDNSGQLNVVLEVAEGVTAESELLVLATDYVNWAVTYTCNNLPNNQRRVFSWVVSRTRQLSPASQIEVNAVVESYLELNDNYYERTDQSDVSCFYFPEPAANEPVIFGGQCDLTIPAVANFQADNYMGLWHEIERYPTPFQFGTCHNAFYELVNGAVDVFNTQVVNEALVSINGQAVPTGTDGKLVVSFPIAGTDQTTESDYWVLSTDYTSYSLVYSCRNINEYQQQVTVWKLSRSKTLSAAAVTAIDAVLATQDVLYQPYFAPTDQSAAGCFYYPEPQLGVPVVFPGQCESNIPVVANFNTAQWQGQWYEVEGYPKTTQPGVCVSHEFSAGTGTAALNLVTSSVADQLLGSTNGNLVFYTGETGGRFTLSIDGGVSFPYYVIATDYTDYALVYSCMNINNDYRGIWSWKLSRNRQQLSTAANLAINNAMANIDVISNDYFESVDQSEDACFYFPDLAPGEPVIMPGTCEADIPVVQNFNVDAYLGRWRLLESYPADDQIGQCNQATYSNSTDGTITVYNNEVANQALREITGSATLAAEVGGETTGRLIVTFPDGNTREIWILDTDYESYSIAYGCENLANQQRRVWSWKLSRTTSFTAAAITAMDNVINNVNVLNQRYYQTVDHSDTACFYFPTPGSGPTIFPGQCDTTIPVVTNFNAQAYMGLWHDIESYAVPFQDGGCPNAFYTLDETLGRVDVFNTQVLSQTLDTINGYAVLEASTDGSAKLMVTFTSVGADLATPYWVLATDYTSYALVYSCQNIDNERRTVSSWKLSRSKSLTTAATTAINNVINSIQVLDAQYYNVRDQSPDGCFYFPEHQPGVPVVFPGQCDENIPVVSNFNLNQFQGTWHEIEAYPKDTQSGQCINHAFSAGNSDQALSFIATNVLDQLLGTSNGQVTLYPNQNNGRLTLTMTDSSGTVISFPYYVIATDYNDYALVYSCLNLNIDYRGIWSWKLSRNRQQLSAAANLAINNALTNIDVLSNDYFESVDQSEDACFYFPDLAPGEPVIMPGTCEADIPVVQNFNVDAYLGRWRLLESYPADDQIGQCNQATYSNSTDGTITVYNNEVANQALREITGSATLAAEVGGETTGRLIVTFPDGNTREIWILDTDYESYSIAYGCENLANQQRRVWSWKLSRTTSFTAAAITAMDNVINNVNVLNQRYYQTVDHSDTACFYFPTPGSGPTIFPGQCDTTIPVVTNFNAQAYMGLWHDIESYAVPFQDGGCPNAFYSLDETLGRVDVFNTQVLSQTLDTINGYAVLEASTDGSAKLMVTFPSVDADLATPYWVLATDYTSYALVYSCQNIDNERRTVSSWKLSRSKSLTTAATTAINNVINSIQVLDAQYYNVRDQSPEGCFYFPEHQPGVPVVFPGQCDENIPVVSNFNLNQFQGTWHEIEAYPKDTQSGQCINHAFSSGNSDQALSFIATHVLDQLLGTSNGQVTLYPNQNNGRLTLTMTDATGTVISFPYYVIATDYNDYALVYSCLNLNSDYRGIWSWKLSRNRQQLSAAANLAINNALTNIDVLSNDYFESVDQSEDACFYFPDLAPGEPVIMPGTCEADIPVVQNFNVDAYLGRWRLLESYPADDQIGQCNQATYSNSTDGTITVYNNEVANQALREITGSATLAAEVGGETTGRLIVTFPDGNTREIWILDTDYESYSIAYGCENLANQQRRVWSWKLSRTTSFTAAAITAMDNVINNVNVLNQRYYQTVDHSDTACFYFPTPGSGPTIFPGQCDTTIPVVTNFNAQAYMGLWHDIESYAVPFQDGGCPNAFYSLDETLGRVDVFNTQVLSQTLDTINGYAVLEASTDGSAKLMVTFPSVDADLATPYWVLATDYTSYALVYSCQNIDNERRTVSSWKLSRSKSLTTAATTAINNVINSIQVLDAQYYNVRDQSPEGCFYFPEHQPGVPVVFPGQCDENIPVVSNFNLNQFQGTWHEIEAYPKDTQSGQCINHAFSSGNSDQALSFIATHVLDQLLGTSNGQVTLYPNQNNGRLTLTMTDATGTVISFPYYVIATDYNDYALVYSCLNLNSDYRGIWSWKLSRNRQQLSAAANLAINNALTNIDVLSNDYFESVDQSEDACFYFPDLAPGEPVIMPGTCEADIPVVQNFNVDAYLGRWRLLESYPADDQIGQCNQATYSNSTDGTITVYNNEVANQALREITGSATLAAEVGGETTGRLIVTFPDGNTREIWILDTDYESYSIAYGCENLANQQRRVWSWKLSRTTSFTAAAITAMDNVINNVNVLNQRYYQTVDHSDTACFYFPTPGSGPTIFPGQCDTTIPVVTNFNAQAYMGLWHDIESYAVPFQDGGCPNAFYSLDETLGRVDVFNTQVLSQTLDTINGYAVLEASTDGSAKLMVTFPSVDADLATPYWVLATDYTSYALVYSCQNIDNERRTVSSWKLSRSKSLTTAATTAINNVINSIQVLDAQYYNVRDQSPEGCFYFPEHQPGVPVVFPGQCDENIPVVSNFNLNQFQGTWHEIEAYPKDTQSGQCINHAFSSGNSDQALSFIATHVLDQLLGTSNGQVTLYPNQNNGRLTLTMTDATGTVISFPYYVIATDYNDYALVYSCLNLNSDYRGIWSWKLSRNRQQLSAAANLAINNALTNIDVLSNDYFESVDQSEDACFYFPDLAPGEPVIMPGTCEADIPVVQNFNVDAYLGRWRLLESYPADDQIGQCNQATYSNSTDSTITVYNNEVANQALREITGSATLAAEVGGETTGRLIVTFPDGNTREIWILDTDYESYSIAYGCENLANQQRRVWSWKLSRTTSFTAAAITAMDNVINNVNVLNQRYYQTVDHSDTACFYFPTPGSGPTIFPGQCDTTIPVVTNFNAQAYMGLWHDIESYAVPFQDGGCPNAFYSLDETLGRVDVFNTQVLSQTLDTINGYAVLEASTDGSAKLMVTFPSVDADLATPYWVLATDYTSYALVYSCQNIDNERRTVSSWKLSRSKSLTTAATTAINNVINSIQVLGAQYYNVRDQSPEGCFYFPEHEPGVPVVFPGQCDEDIPVVNNFALSEFAGIWHEVEAYPKIEQTGQCTNHQFTVNGNTLDMQSLNVIAESLGITSGTVTFAYNDNTARMTIRFTSNGQVIEIPYWIVDTDYSNYALAYSCVNQDSDYRGIWSWKLSRTKQLTAASETAINQAIANIDVLGNSYFEPVDQTDEACFFYPETSPGEAVVFPGQCDNSITGIQNFDAGRYLGLWRTIESYPSDFQAGTCGDAYYALGDGVVDVYNTEVVNQALSTINGTAVASTDGTGKLLVTFPGAPFPVEYVILATDYDTYSLVYSCVNINSDQRRVFSWKLGRTNSLPQNAVTAITNVVNSINVLDERYFEAEDRTPEGCFYFPEPNDSPVVFRGQCNENVVVVANFDVNAYTGIWYNIESYPAPFQGGTCGRATYTLDEVTGIVSVENSQVLDQMLDVQTGTAVLADGTNGKLSVTFEVNGESITADYWVLATDYTSYSLVYSCENINDEYKRVSSWKLSRSQQLPATAVPAINAAIGAVQVLDQQYFVPEGHSEVDCFFYPDNNGGDVVLDGQCVPDNQVPAVTNFNVNAFSGTWHEVGRFPSDLQVGECAEADFTPGATNALTITQTIVNDEFQTTAIIPGTVSADGRGVISANVAGVPFDALYILDTDYTEYALIYGCRELENDQKQIYSWKLARSRAGLSAAANSAIDQIVSTNIDLFERYYSSTEQSNDACFHYPEFDELPDSIDLPGPCDESIRGVPNFNAAAYTGRWVEIERYPQTNQFGVCDRAYYTAGPDSVLVRNTHVVGDELQEQLGSAVVASDDGSGLLEVTFNVNGVEVNANYYVLATDYTNYALVYSCRNIADNRRLVSSWKLSRTTSLSAQANAAIDATIAQTQGLSQDYYQTTSQTVEDCFYIPAVETDVAPLYRGQCESVSGVENFDAEAFMGWWHEMERFPVDYTAGECISSHYSSASGSFQMVDTAVANGTADVITGSVTVTDGRLRRLLSNGQEQEIVVLATDYSNYALLYSCEDVDIFGEAYRRVWSAKHSETRSLTAADQAAMAPAIANSEVLYDRFYQEVTHSDQACFHYPEVSGQRVVLPGQCDENIPVVADFDVGAYGGTWYQIERYPQPHEDPSATCTGARYILNAENGEVQVLNWEVIDGVLETIEGVATLASDDGSAKLSVVLPIVGTNDTVETSLYVLATDYEDYALVYSCSNINDFQRSIGAWKLSRERTLSSEGVTAIETHMGTREELDARYFLQVEQSQDCEEPSAGALIKSSFIVILVCAVIQLLY